MSQQRGLATRGEALGKPLRAACASVMVSPQKTEGTPKLTVQLWMPCSRDWP